MEQSYHSQDQNVVSQILNKYQNEYYLYLWLLFNHAETNSNKPNSIVAVTHLNI